jgi:death-on-curing family protein
MSEIIYPSVEELMEVNKLVLEEIRVSKHDKIGVLPSGMVILGGIVKNTKDEEGDVFDKAIVLLKGIIQRHPFDSGNRRTGIVSAAAFLEVNGKKLEIMEETDYIQGVRERYYKDSEIKKWMKGGKIREFDRFH